MLRSTTILGGALLFAVAIAVAPASAVPIAYSEPPDLSGNQATPTDLGALDIGVNTVSGGIAASNLNIADTDGFIVSLAAGLRITDISIAISDFTGENAIGRNREIGIGTTLPIIIDDLYTADGTVNQFAGSAAGPGTLQLQQTLGPINITAGGSGSYNYIVSITVEAVGEVPEPATLSLFGGALLGLAARRRKAA